MAYNTNTPVQRANSGLPSSISYLDGVPFKIGIAFRPPPKVILPPQLSTYNRHGVLSEEYSFDVEEEFLRMYEAMQHAQDDEAQAEENRVVDRIEQFTRLPISSDDESPIYTAVETIGESSDAVSDEVSPWVNPVIANLSSDILLPVPIAPASQVVAPESLPTESAFDMKLFDKEDDPFDNLELQTLDDFEELRTVLQGPEPIGSHSNIRPSQSEPVENTLSRKVVNNWANTDSSQSVVSPVVNGLDCEPLYENINMSTSPVNKFTMTQNSNQNYVNVELRKKSNLFSESDESSPPSGLTNKPAVSSLTNMAGLAEMPLVRKSLLPPIKSVASSTNPQRHSSALLNGELKKNSYENVEISKSGVLFTRGLNDSNMYSRHSNVPTYENMALVDKDNINGTGEGILRNTKSNPDIYRTENREGSPLQHPTSYTPPPVTPLSGHPASITPPPARPLSGQPASITPPPARPLSGQPASITPPPARPLSGHPTSITPPPVKPLTGQLQTSSTEQGGLWNPYNPLPPTPRTEERPKPIPKPRPAPRTGKPVSTSNVMTPSSSGRETNTQNKDCSNGSSMDTSINPYPMLNQEEQKLVNRLATMGFRQPRVARAVHKLGKDEKEVVDHLCTVDSLTEKGYNLEMAETALHLFDNNLTKAQSYLDLYVQFLELGFAADKVCEALVVHNMDRDKTLDFLTA